MDAAPNRRPNTWEEDVVLQYKFRQRLLRSTWIAAALANLLYVFITLDSSNRELKLTVFASRSTSSTESCCLR
jgi:hypothetical protein